MTKESVFESPALNQAHDWDDPTSFRNPQVRQIMRDILDFGWLEKLKRDGVREDEKERINQIAQKMRRQFYL